MKSLINSETLFKKYINKYVLIRTRIGLLHFGKLVFLDLDSEYACLRYFSTVLSAPDAYKRGEISILNIADTEIDIDGFKFSIEGKNMITGDVQEVVLCSKVAKNSIKNNIKRNSSVPEAKNNVVNLNKKEGN